MISFKLDILIFSNEFLDIFYFFTVRDKFKLTKALSVDPIYLRYKEMDKAIDYRVI